RRAARPGPTSSSASAVSTAATPSRCTSSTRWAWTTCPARRSGSPWPGSRPAAPPSPRRGATRAEVANLADMADDSGTSDLDHEPPEEIDPELWFACAAHPDGRDLVVGNAHTFAGRIAAVCPQDDGRRYYASAYSVLQDCPPATRYWVQGFLAGCEPTPPRGP